MVREEIITSLERPGGIDVGRNILELLRQIHVLQPLQLLQHG